MRVVGPLFLPPVQEVIRDEEVALAFLKTFWSQTVEGGLANSPAPLRLRNCTLEVGVSGREWARSLREMAQPLMAKVNWFMSRRLAQHLDFQVVDLRPGDSSS